MERPTPHLVKLRAARDNPKLPESDGPRLDEALARYEAWIADLTRVTEEAPEDEILTELVRHLTDYKRWIDLDLVFDSEGDFLYRQKGQLKLDNTIIEEFLPWLFAPRLVPGLADDVQLGPRGCFSAAFFESSVAQPGRGAGFRLRTKDQDFAISRRLYLRCSFDAEFTDAVTHEAAIAYIAAEIKTNLDKTMFQEGSATASDVKLSVPGAKYFLLCEWLDMTPVSSSVTAIDEVLLMRGAKRITSNVRSKFATRKGRAAAREEFAEFLDAAPFQPHVFQRLVDHAKAMLTDDTPPTEEVLRRGYF